MCECQAQEKFIATYMKLKLDIYFYKKSGRGKHLFNAKSY
jgi:hypothetical protein